MFNSRLCVGKLHTNRYSVSSLRAYLAIFFIEDLDEFIILMSMRRVEKCGDFCLRRNVY